VMSDLRTTSRTVSGSSTDSVSSSDAIPVAMLEHTGRRNERVRGVVALELYSARG
jgi:hypothetical protein